MRRLHESGTKRIVVAIPMIYAEGLKRLAVGGKTVSSLVREALDKFFGVAAAEPSKQDVGGMMFPKAKWRGREKGAK